MIRFQTISEFLAYRHLPAPEHPLIAVFEVQQVGRMVIDEPISWMYDFYAIGLKHVVNAHEVRLKYGQQAYDYDNGILSFVAPGQVMRFEIAPDTEILQQSGWMLLIHPDLLWNNLLARQIKTYDFWDYSVHEALFLSAKEEATLVQLIQNIQQESRANLDQFSKRIMLSHIETLLNYADRFYNRQFITREKANHQILERMERLLNQQLDSGTLPTVHNVAGQLNLSPKYLSSLLKTLTGQNTQQHIHEKLIERAKAQLSTTELSVSEIAYGLGFEHVQSFSKLFKAKTQYTPVGFRMAFN